MRERAYSYLTRLVLISRPIFYLPLLALYGAGVALTRAPIDFSVVYGAFLLTFPLSLVLFGTNDIYDQETDRLNPRKGKLYGALLQDDEVATLRKVIIGMTGFSIVSAFAICGTAFGVIIAAICLLSYAYSVPPIKLKRRALLDAMTNGAWMVLVFLSGVVVASDTAVLEIVKPSFLLSMFVFIMAGHIATTLIDYEPDKQAGEHTTAVAFGVRITSIIVAVLFCVSAVLMWFGTHQGPRALLAIGYIMLGVLCAVSTMFYYNPAVLRKMSLVYMLLFPVLVVLLLLI